VRHITHILPSGAKISFEIDDSCSSPLINVTHEGEFDSYDLEPILIAFNITLVEFDGRAIEINAPSWIKILLDATATNNVRLIDLEKHLCECQKCKEAREVLFQSCPCERCQAARQAQFN
jgi:hypothetical protein